jgi:hypothetical protein
VHLTVYYRLCSGENLDITMWAAWLGEARHGLVPVLTGQFAHQGLCYRVIGTETWAAFTLIDYRVLKG